MYVKHQCHVGVTSTVIMFVRSVAVMAVILIKLVIAPHSPDTDVNITALALPRNHRNITTPQVLQTPGPVVMSRQTQDNIFQDVMRNIDLSRGTNSLQTYNSTDNSNYTVGYSGNPFGSHTNYIETHRQGGETARSKRSVVHLYNMVLCATGCDPLAYKGYGCYCGFLGSGFAVDAIDNCCRMHDWCYDTAGCPMFLEYFIPYLWKCYHGTPLCAIDHGNYGGPGSCAQRLCECDRALAQCLRRYPCPNTKALCTSSTWRLLQNLFML